MNVLEARRARHLVIHIDRGEELPAALLRALDEVEARAGWIDGTGSIEAAELAVFDQTSRTYAKTRRLDGPWDVVALSGTVALQEGEGSVRLSVTLARESDTGLQLSAGELVWARAYSLDLRVTVFDDLKFARITNERTGLAQLAAQPAGASALAPESTRHAPTAEPARTTPTPTEPVRATPTEPVRATPSTTIVAPAADPPAMPLPQRPVRPRQEDEQVYPEVGDMVMHFAFGECEVITSDGERIRLRQERDGRVREVSLTMLKIQPPTVDPSTGKKHFHLTRKN
jgi:predicted DNA-binding protein with PD1-like motif